MSLRALIADPTVPASSQLRRFLEGAGFQVRVVHFLDEAVEELRKDVDILFAAASSNFDGESLSLKAKEIRPQCPVVLVYPPDEEDPEPYAQRAKADACLISPLRKGTVVSCAHAMLRLQELRDTAARLEGDLKRQKAAPARKDVETLTAGGADQAFFKRFLLMEVKRSRRYRFPVSMLVVGLEPPSGRSVTDRDRRVMGARALAAVSRGLRDIDLAVPAGDGRCLVYLTHTGREGAQIVSERLRQRILKVKRLEGCSVSVGVASYDGAAKEVSVGGLMKEATDALRRAEKGGGNRVELGGERPKRDRIVMG